MGCKGSYKVGYEGTARVKVNIAFGALWSLGWLMILIPLVLYSELLIIPAFACYFGASGLAGWIVMRKV